MITYQLNGESFDIDIFQVIGDVQYPAGWFQEKTNRDAMGIVEVEVADLVGSPAPLTVADYEAAVQKHLDDTAYLYGYDSLISAITYADEPAVTAFQVEGQAFRACRSLTWAKCREVLTAYENGERQAPTVAELLAELPPLDLPPPTLGRSV